MEFRVSVVRRPGYLHVQVWGDNSLETVRKYIREIRQAVLHYDCPAVLIEENLQGPGLSLGEMYEVVREESLDRSRMIRLIVLVDVNPDHNPEDMRFVETAAMNRAMNFHVFPTVADAETWIRRELAPPASQDSAAARAARA